MENKLTQNSLSVDSRILIQLYEDVLRKYPFSITGRPNPEKRLADFFARFCRHPIVKEKGNIIFIIALYAELESLQFENLTLEHVINWHTRPLKNLLLFNYEGEYPDLILSFYLTLLSYISKKDITATNIIADNIRSDVDLRIKITQFHEPSIHFIEREDVIEFRTPHKIFKENLWDEKRGCLKTGEVRRILQRYLPKERVETQLIATANREAPHIFRIDRTRRNAFQETDASGEITSPAINEIIDMNKLEETRDSYFDEFTRLSNRILAGRLKDSDDIKDLTWIALGGAFLAAYYDINLDYVLSVCNVYEKKRQKEELFTLGGLAIGSKRSSPLSIGERVLFSMVSDHISANLSAQMAHEMFNKQFLRGKANEVIKRFADTGKSFHDLIEMKRSGEKTAKLAVQALKDYWQYEINKVISVATEEEIKRYLRKLENSNKLEAQDYEKARSEFTVVRNIIMLSARELWKYLNDEKERFEQDGIKFTLDPPENDLSSTRLYADYGWIQEVIKIALGNIAKLDDKAFDPRVFNGQGREAEVVVSLSLLDEQGDRVLKCFIKDNGIGCDVHDIPVRKGGYKLFFETSSNEDQRYRDVLNAHGNLTIESREKKLDFLRPDKKLSSKFKDAGTLVTLTLNWVPDEDTGY